MSMSEPSFPPYQYRFQEGDWCFVKTIYVARGSTWWPILSWIPEMKYNWIEKVMNILKRILMDRDKDAAIEARIVRARFKTMSQRIRTLVSLWFSCCIHLEKSESKRRSDMIEYFFHKAFCLFASKSSCVCSLRFRIAEFVQVNGWIYLFCWPNRTMYYWRCFNGLIITTPWAFSFRFWFINCLCVGSSKFFKYGFSFGR